MTGRLRFSARGFHANLARPLGHGQDPAAADPKLYELASLNPDHELGSDAGHSGGVRACVNCNFVHCGNHRQYIRRRKAASDKAQEERQAEAADPASKSAMLKIADEYEILAQRAEDRLPHKPPEPWGRIDPLSC